MAVGSSEANVSLIPGGLAVERPCLPYLPPLPRPASPRSTGRMDHRWLIILAAVLIAITSILPGFLAVLAIVGVVAFSFLLAHPNFALLAVTFAVPFESLKSVSVGGLSLTVTDILIFSAALTWFGYVLISGELQIPVRGGWRWPLLIYGIVLLLSMSQSIDLKSSIKEMIKWLEMLLVYLMVQRSVTTRARVELLLGLLLAAGIAECCVGFLQVFHIGRGLFHAAGVVRPAGTFDQPNPYAGFLNMSLPLAIALLLTQAQQWRRLARWSVVLVGIAVVVALSRGGWLAILTALGVMLALARPQWRTQLSVVGIALLTIVLASIFGAIPFGLGDKIAESFAVANIDVANPTPANWSAAERLAHQIAGLNMFADHPLLGVGIGNYAAQYPKYQVAPVWGDALGHAHNYFINIAAEAGVPGVLAFLFLISSAGVLCLQLWRKGATPLQRAIGLGALGVIIGIVVANMFDNLFVHGMDNQIALIMGLVAVAGQYAGPSSELVGE